MAIFHICTSPGSWHSIFIFIISYNLLLASLWLPEVFIIWESQRGPQSTVLSIGCWADSYLALVDLALLEGCADPLWSKALPSPARSSGLAQRDGQSLLLKAASHASNLTSCLAGKAGLARATRSLIQLPHLGGMAHIDFPTLPFLFSNPICSFHFLKQEIVFHAYQYLYFLHTLDPHPRSQLFWKCLPTWPRSS